MTLTLTLHPEELTFDKRAELIVEAMAEKGVTVELGDYGGSSEGGEHQFEYRLRRLDRRPPELTKDGKRRWSQRYEIEFFLPGEYELPPAALTYVDGRAPAPSPADSKANAEKRDDSDAATESAAKTLKTESVKVIARATEEATLSPEELKTIRVLPPVELREPWSRWWLVAPPLLAAAIAALFWLLRRSRRAFVAPVEIIPAHEWARREFAALVAADMIARGLVQEFYYRISAVVRGYIERRYDVSAPDMTTEEFLAAASDDPRFESGATGELQRFLTACDLVKYARHRPDPGEWNELLRAASDFVERTRERPLRNTMVGDAAAPPLEAASA